MAVKQALHRSSTTSGIGLPKRCHGKEKTQKVLLRVNPGIDAHTHAYIQTTKNDSKFGESIFDEAIFDVIATISNSDALIFDGLHCHIGSQIFEEQSFIDEAKAMVDFSSQVYEKTGIATHKLNLGGGFGVYYVEGDKPFDYVVVLKRILDKIADHYEAKGMVWRFSSSLVAPSSQTPAPPCMKSAESKKPTAAKDTFLSTAA